jgi:hypothetical protein
MDSMEETTKLGRACKGDTTSIEGYPKTKHIPVRARELLAVPMSLPIIYFTLVTENQEPIHKGESCMTINARNNRRLNVKNAKYITHLRMNPTTKQRWNIVAERMEERTGLSLSDAKVFELMLENYA